MSDVTLFDAPTNEESAGYDWRWELSDPGLGGPRAMGAAGGLRAGDRVPGTPYVVLRCIGQGGMGEVYEVEHTEANLRGALKVLHHRHVERDDLVARMWREGRVLAAVEHPSVVGLLDLGQIADGRPFLVMELLEGHDLREVLTAAGPMPVDQAIRLITEALDGLSAVHAAGVVHRDIKLENLFLCRDGGLKVIDFGVAKARWAETSPTFPGFVPGTPRTMAPEQCSQQSVDPRADLYAIGLALYELCVGRGPFDDLRDHPQALRFAHCTRTPPQPSELASQPIPHDVQEAILRALAKSPSKRFQSAREMAAALRRLLAPKPSPTTPFPARRPRRGRAATRRGVRVFPELFCAFLLVFFALGMVLGRVLAAPLPASPPRAAPSMNDLSAIPCKRPTASALSWPSEDGRT